MKTIHPISSSARSIASIAASLMLLLFSSASAQAEDHVPGGLKGTVTLELIGQAVVQSPTSAIQFGYLSRIVGLDQIFTTTPENEATAMFTFYNETATTRVINNGPVRIVNREGTATFYFNPAAGGTYSNPDTFRTGIPVMTANLTHQVLFDTVQSTFITQFSLTITSAAEFRVGHEHLRLGKPGQKATWVVYGRPNAPDTSSTFAIAGFSLAQ